MSRKTKLFPVQETSNFMCLTLPLDLLLNFLFFRFHLDIKSLGTG